LETSNAITGGTVNMDGALFNETAANAISGSTVVNMNSYGGNAILSAANNYTGPTTVVGGSNPAQINGFYVFGAALDFSEANSPVTNIINNGISHANISTGSSLTLSGGSLYVVGANGAANSQEFNGLTVTSGNSNLVADAGTGGGTTEIDLNAITRQTGGLINFGSNVYAPNGAGTTTITTTTANSNFAGGQQTILGGWATVGNEYWAVSGTGATPGAITALTTYAQFSENMTAGQDVNVASQTDFTNAASVNSLRFSGSGSDILFTSPVATIASGGILVADFNNSGNLIEGANDSDAQALALPGPFAITSGNGQDLDVIYRDSSDGLIIDANIVDNGITPIGLTFNGQGGTLTLGGSNTFTGPLTINSGTIMLNSADALDGQPTVVFGGDGSVASGNLELNGNSVTVSGLTQAAGQGYAINGGMNVYNNSGTTATLTVDNATNDTFDGGISDNGSSGSGTGSLNFVKNGAGNLNLTTSIYNNNDRISLGYTGTTTINEGGVYLSASSGASYLTNTSIISVNGGGSLGGGNAVTVGHAFTNGPSTGALGEFQGVQVAGGSTPATQGSINLQDGVSSTFRIAQDAGQTGLYIGGATGNPGAISLDVGYSTATNSSADALALQYMSSGYTSGNTVNSGNIYIAPGGFQLNLNGLGTLQGTPYNPLTIMEVGGFDTTSTGFGGNTFGTGYASFSAALAANAITLNTSGNFNGYVVSLAAPYNDPNGGYDLGIIETANPTPTTAYFSGADGASGNAWNTFTGGNANNSNWTTADGGGSDTNQTPGAQTDVYFGTAPTAPAALANYLNNTLGADTTIKSLTFTSNSTGNITIGDPTHILTINGNAGNGITDNGAGAETITANVNLGSSQTWTNNSSNPLTVSGDVLDNNLSGNNMGVSNGYSLTKAGTGRLVLSGTNSYSGGTTVAAGELDAMNTMGSATGSGGLIVNDLATLAGRGIIAPAAGNNVEIQSGAFLSPGLTGVGTLTFNMSGASSVAFDAGSTLALSLGSNSTSVAFSSLGDYLSGSGNATLSLSLGAGFSYANTYTVFANANTPGFNFGSITGYDTTDYVAVFTDNGANDTLSFQSLDVVPEPSQFGLMFLGLGVLGFLYRRKVRLS
jgi:autotransporter-associated beta strand protein